jgi:hypothetical protein
MLIGINGKIGSGKDTIGKIIQCLMNHPKITNKDLIWMMENNIVAEDSKCKIKKFAGKLKQIGSILTGVPVEMFEDQEFKKLEMGEQWSYIKEIPLIGFNNNIIGSDSELIQMTYREFLQRLGTEAMRDGLHTNVWVNALFADYKRALDLVKSEDPKYDLKVEEVGEYPNWIITDMRFPNEMEAVEQRKGITIRVHRDLHNGNAHISPIPHASETALDDAKFDYEIINDGTLEDLVDKVKEILIKENII